MREQGDGEKVIFKEIYKDEILRYEEVQNLRLNKYINLVIIFKGNLYLDILGWM